MLITFINVEHFSLESTGVKLGKSEILTVDSAEVSELDFLTFSFTYNGERLFIEKGMGNRAYLSRLQYELDRRGVPRLE
jgi:hypothetical protein